jgi:selenocysteine-specific elongation factor
VRNLQVYNQPVEKACAGQRTAVNLQGIETSELERGNVLVRAQTFTETQSVDAYLDYLPGAGRPLKHRTIQRFHTGASNTTASIYLLDKEELSPGEGGFVQLRLDRPVVALPQDRFVIRGSGSIQTLGGGVLLDTHPLKHKRFAPSLIKDLTILKEGKHDEILAQHVLRSGMGGVTYRELLNRVAQPPKEIEGLLKKMVQAGGVISIDPERMKVIDAGQYRLLQEAALAQLKEFHQRSPLKSGLAKEELRSKLPEEVDVRLFQMMLQELIRSKKLVLEKDKLRLSSHQISSVDEKGLVKRGEEAIRKGGLQPPSSRELAEEWAETEEEVRAALEHLVHEGALIKIKSDMYFHREPFEKLKEELVAYLRSRQEITTAQFKEITGASRKYVIPLIEYFDQIKLTLRLGEKRVLRSTGSS